VSDPLQLIQDGVLRFLFPVIEEYILKERRKVFVRFDALPVVQLGEELNVQRQCQYRPGALPEHHLGDLIRLRLKPIAGRHCIRSELLDAAERFLMLQFLVSEPHQRLQRGLVSDPAVVHVRTEEEMREAERTNILAVLNRTRWKVYGRGGAAGLLGLKPGTLAARM